MAESKQLGDRRGSAVEIDQAGTLRLVGSGTITLAGDAGFTNSGILDIRNWIGRLPEGFANNGTVLGEERWSLYPVGEDGWAFTGSFLGWVHAGAAPWIYVYPLEQWMYCDEEWVIDGTGSWIFAPEMALGTHVEGEVWAGYPVGDDGWIESTPLGRIHPDGNHAWIEQLATWVYVPWPDTEEQVSWIFVFN